MKCTNVFYLFNWFKTDIKNTDLKIIISATINLSIETNIVDLDSES